jgi:hypothetical protein
MQIKEQTEKQRAGRQALVDIKSGTKFKNNENEGSYDEQ